MTDDRGFQERQRERLIQQRKREYAIKYELETGKEYHPNKSGLDVRRDAWLQRFAQIPREERTRQQWRTFERFHKQIYGNNDVWGEYD